KGVEFKLLIAGDHSGTVHDDIQRTDSGEKLLQSREISNVTVGNLDIRNFGCSGKSGDKDLASGDGKSFRGCASDTGGPARDQGSFAVKIPLNIRAVECQLYRITH